MPGFKQLPTVLILEIMLRSMHPFASKDIKAQRDKLFTMTKPTVELELETHRTPVSGFLTPRVHV